MTERDDSWWAALCLWCVDGIGAARYRTLEKAFGSAAAAWEAGPRAWEETLGNYSWTTAEDVAEIRPDYVRAALAQCGARAVRRDEAEFPVRLAEVAPLPWLFVRGSAAVLDEPLAAVVGTRGVRPEGMRLTEEVTGWCLERGYGTVSGGARGVDTAAHQATIARGGRTVVVLPAGHGHPAPPSNKGLFNSVCAAEGCLVSEWPPWRVARDRLFVRRNRLISGLSVLTIVVRAPLRSGALITADWARRQGRPLFAVPGTPRDPTAVGCIELIRRGAGMLGAADDLPRARAADPHSMEEAPVPPASPVPVEDELGTRSRALLAEMSRGAAELEELVGRLKWTPAEVMVELSRLLLAGRVQQAGAGRYRPIQAVRSR